MLMKRITFNAPMNHKAYSYEPIQIEVEKVISLYGKRFEQMRDHPLEDAPEIIENRELIYMEGNTATAFCSLMQTAATESLWKPRDRIMLGSHSSFQMQEQSLKYSELNEKYRGLMIYYDEDSPINEKIISAFQFLYPLDTSF